jgi:hypothetical protein
MVIGSTPDVIVALHVASSRLRPCDNESMGIEENKTDLENGQDKFLISAADDSETISIFDTDKVGKPAYSTKIKQSQGSPSHLKTKDLFGLGYPYFICAYDGHVAVTTDFGICLLSFK